MDRIIRFEQELSEDQPEANPILFEGFNPILFEGFNRWGSMRRYLVIELTEGELQFFIEDRGKIILTPSRAYIQEMRIVRAEKRIGIYESHSTVALPKGMNPHEIYIKLRLLETAPRELAVNIMWNLFYWLEIEPCFNTPRESWLYPYANNYLNNMHSLIYQEHMRKIEEVMQV